MQSGMASEEGCVTTMWEINNFSLLLKEDPFVSLWSPAWKIEKTKGSAWWKLKVSNGISEIVFNIQFLKGYSVDRRCDMSIISSCGEVPLKKVTSLDFGLKKNDLFSETGGSNLPNDTLTLCCRMREENIKISELRTSSVLNRLSYLWNIGAEVFGLSSFHSTSIKQGNILLCVSLQKKDGQHDIWTFSVWGVPCVESGISSVVSFSIKDGSGIVINKEPVKLLFETVWRCEIQILTENQKITLQLELMVAYHSVCQEQLMLHSSTETARHKNVSGEGFRVKLHKGCQTKEQLALHSPTGIPGHEDVSGEGSCALGRDFLNLYRDGVLSDVTLQAENPRRSFPAHRSILAARSPGFRSIFEEASGGGSVNMDGVDSGTVGRMLFYLYSHSLEDLGWREASGLYCAADKYGVIHLKEKCAAVLEACLTADNACDALVLADSCSDQSLMERVMLFILDHEEVVSSDQWEELERDKPALAAKITRRLFLRRGKKMRFV